MSTNKADTLTQKKTVPILFSDFLDNFDLHPLNGNLARATNDKSINQALKNLVLTNFGERLFQPSVGCNVYKSLFEPNDDIAKEDLNYAITSTINQNEPRVNLLQVNIDNSLYQQDQISITIVYSIINTTQVQSVNILLSRVR